MKKAFHKTVNSGKDKNTSSSNTNQAESYSQKVEEMAKEIEDNKNEKGTLGNQHKLLESSVDFDTPPPTLLTNVTKTRPGPRNRRPPTRHAKKPSNNDIFTDATSPTKIDRPEIADVPDDSAEIKPNKPIISCK